jgi:hypothetical protein
MRCREPACDGRPRACDGGLSRGGGLGNGPACRAHSQARRGSIPSRRPDEDDERARLLATDPGALRILLRSSVKRLMGQLVCAAHHPAAPAITRTATDATLGHRGPSPSMIRSAHCLDRVRHAIRAPASPAWPESVAVLCASWMTIDPGARLVYTKRTVVREMPSPLASARTHKCGVRRREPNAFCLDKRQSLEPIPTPSPSTSDGSRKVNQAQRLASAGIAPTAHVHVCDDSATLCMSDGPCLGSDKFSG